MPANRGVNGPHWNPKPDFSGTERPGHSAPAVDYNDAAEIAHCLIDDDPSYFTYELFENVDLYPEALEAARAIIRKREATFKLHERELNEASVRQNTAKRTEVRQATRYIGTLSTSRSASVIPFDSYLTAPRRSFG